MMFSKNAGIGGGMPTETCEVLFFTRLDASNLGKSATLLWRFMMVYDIHAGQSSWPVSKEYLKV